jgi:L-ornithine N5-oxygenase
MIGIGFGPAGVALAVAIEDAREENRLQQEWRPLFLERAAGCNWQGDMLLPGTDIQHHFLRDFATPRNPRSRFTFPNYLKCKGRLFAFGLLGGNPGRIEWADYVSWVSNQVDSCARYGHKVKSIEPVFGQGPSIVDALRVIAANQKTGKKSVFQAKNLVMCSGRTPNVPEMFRPWIGPRVFHSHYFKSSIAVFDPAAAPTFAVVGSGQNAIEIILYLADAFPRSRIISINRNHGFRLYDLGHFSNEVYFPEEVDYFFSLSLESRRQMFEDVRLTNYSSVDADVSRALYLRVYEDRVQGDPRIKVIKRVGVAGVTLEAGAYKINLEERFLHTQQQLNADVIILCTGFCEDHVPAYLKPILPYLSFERDGTLAVTRDYRIQTKSNFKPQLYINGLSELTHGISDATSFSMMALKAERIYEGLTNATRSSNVATETPQELQQHETASAF